MAFLLPYSFEPERDDADVSDSEENDSSTTDDGEDANGRRILAYPERLQNMNWCARGSRAIFPSAIECVCCKEVDVLSWRLYDLRCATVHESFQLV